MKLSDLEVGQEYAAHRYQGPNRHSNNAVRCRLIDIRSGKGRYLGDGRHAQATVCEFELLEPSNWGQVTGERFTCLSRYVWSTWEFEAQRRQEAKDREAQRMSVRDIIVRDLGRLGLHDHRHVIAMGQLERSTVELSGAELHKLAERAEHLVELERAIYAWHNSDIVSADALEIDFWAAHHDFGMIEGEAQS